MTKNELIRMCKLPTKIQQEAEFQESLLDFLESNVIIPKGINRHPFADVLHEWIEGADIEFAKSDGSYTDMSSAINYFCTEFRIKAKPEPVYEWQWLTFNRHDNSVRDFLNYAKFMTELEASTHYAERINTEIYKIAKIEETKRERK